MNLKLLLVRWVPPLKRGPPTHYSTALDHLSIDLYEYQTAIAIHHASSVDSMKSKGIK